MRIERLNDSVTEGAIALEVCFNIHAEMASDLLAFPVSSFCNICWTSSTVSGGHVYILSSFDGNGDIGGTV